MSKDSIDIYNTIGKNIKKYRIQKGWTQKELAEAANLAQPAIARMENKTATPQLDTLLKILAPMGKTLAVVPLKNE